MRPTLPLLLSLHLLYRLARSAPSPPSHTRIAIIGAGTAGCTIAARLCIALPDVSLTVFERAPPRNTSDQFVSAAPRHILTAWRSPSLTHRFASLSDPGIALTPSHIVSATTPGGSSAINGLQWTVPVQPAARLGLPALTDHHARRLYRRVYRKLGVRQPPRHVAQLYTPDYLSAAERAGYALDPDPFSTRPRRAVWANRIATDANARRVDACRAYLDPVLRDGKCRANVNIVHGVTVTRLLLGEGSNPRVEGLEWSDAMGRVGTTWVADDVILSAGPFRSPQLLQVSGIGPRNVLQTAGVQVRVDLGVGEETQGRVFTPYVSLYRGVDMEPANNRELVESVEERQKWERGGGGVVGTSVFAVNGVVGKLAYFLGMMVGFSPELENLPVVASVCVSNPESVGWVRVKSGNIEDEMDVKLNLLGSPSEVRNVVKCVKEMEKIHNEWPRNFSMEPLNPAGEVTEQYVRENSQFSYHFVGGCAAGRVVDGRFAVKGVRGLRVVDASVIKKIPRSAGPMAATYMLAEYFAENFAVCYRSRVRRWWLPGWFLCKSGW